MFIQSVTVVGSTGTEYQVSVNVTNGQPQCSCPSYRYRRARCKHIYFLLEAFADAPAGKRLKLVK